MSTVKTVNEGVWVVEESTALSSLTIAEGASLAAPEGKSLTTHAAAPLAAFSISASTGLIDSI